jgi:hypothetical protein
MRVMGLAVLSLFMAFLAALGSYSYGEPAGQPGISFSLPYRCGTEKDGKTPKEMFCLSDSFPSGLNLVLVSKKEKCSPKTADTFTAGHAANEFEATYLKRTENCFADDDENRFRVAVIGVDPSAVHVVEPKTDKSALSKDIELKARKIASNVYQNLSEPTQPAVDVADSSPDVFSVGNTAFLIFECTDEFYNQEGLPVLILNNNAFLLEGMCASRSPFFFTVNNKLHVSYWATVACCGCGDSNFFVYDLSGESPMQVYHNSDFST